MMNEVDFDNAGYDHSMFARNWLTQMGRIDKEKHDIGREELYFVDMSVKTSQHASLFRFDT